MKNIFIFRNSDFSMKSADFIKDAIERKYKKSKNLDIMLTGGNSIKSIYRKIDPHFFENKTINIYLSDERSVSIQNHESNYKNIEKNLFNSKIPKSINIKNFFLKRKNISDQLISYEKELPNNLDLLILSIGSDGHIASIFPNDKKCHLTKRKVVKTLNPYDKQIRYTISKNVITKARQIIVIVKGKSKGIILNEMTKDKDMLKIPARIIKNASWLLDLSAANEFFIK